jgi:hypothetical protein
LGRWIDVRSAHARPRPRPHPERGF